MNPKFLGVAGALLATTSTAFAGGLERAIPSISPLFEEGTYLEFSTQVVLPDLSGDDGVVPGAFLGSPVDFPITGNSGNLLEEHVSFGAALKGDIGARFSYALILNQPLGANTAYPTDPSADGVPPFTATEIYNGSSASLTSYALTAILAYETNGFSVYAGPVLQSITADASLSFIGDAANGGYSVDAGTAFGFGYMGGVAYERKDIALRVALTYRSSIRHEFDTTETNGLAVTETTTTIDTPQTLTLDFQTGVAPNTLVFGQIHWADWSEFEISPPDYPLLAIGRPLVAYSEDYWTYTLGVGRRFNERWSGAFSVTWEPQTGQEVTSLGPVDGRIGLTAGATWENARMKITGGASYSFLGDAENVLATDFNGGSAIGLGLRVGFKL
ncbi:MAG: outer membrane protein transport protein [Pseudomonadota bacterium]